MDFGIAITPTAAAGDVAARAEALGFSPIWFDDTQLLCHDILVAMTAAALKTSRSKLCAGVLVPSNPLAAVAANALASLNALAPGRVIAGLGTGYTARRTMGLPAQKLDDIREYARVMRALWRGERVETAIEGNRHKIQFMHPPHIGRRLRQHGRCHTGPSVGVRAERPAIGRRHRRRLHQSLDRSGNAGRYPQ